MKDNGFISIMVINSIMWISSAAVIGYAVYTTGRVGALWALLIPALCGYSYKSNPVEKNEEVTKEK